MEAGTTGQAHHTERVYRMKALSRIFAQGLLAVLPVSITIYILYWLGWSAESLLGGLIQKVIPPERYWPGMGLVAAVLLIFAVGMVMNAWIIRTVFGWGEDLLNRIPLVKTLYGPMRDLLNFFSASDRKAMSQVVVVTLGETRVRLLGFVTRQTFTDLPRGVGEAEDVAVYLPMSYQLGGFTTIVPRSAIQPINMSLEAAMRFALTAGVAAGPTEAKPAPGG
jgi:uncharacterized membrane protein